MEVPLWLILLLGLLTVMTAVNLGLAIEFLKGLWRHSNMMQGELTTSNAKTTKLDETMKDVADVLKKIDGRLESGKVLQ